MLTRIGKLSPSAEASSDIALEKAAACKQRGNELLIKGQLDEASACYLDAIAIAPDYAEAFNNLGHVCLRLGRDGEAKRYLEHAVALNPNLANAHYNLGIWFQKNGQPERAVDSYQKALSLAPDNADAHYSLGELLLGQGRNDEALESLRRATELKPDHFLAHHSLGVTFEKLGRLHDAGESFRRSVSLNPDFHVGHFNLATVLRQAGQGKEAMACLHTAVALCPDFVEAYNEIGNLLRAQNQLEAAVLYYEKAVALRPTHAVAHKNLGLALVAQERPDEALNCFKEAVRIDPDFAVAHLCLGDVLQKRGRIAEALSSAETAIALAPDVAESHIVKGLALKDLGRLNEAATCLRHALALKPEKLEAVEFALSTILLARGEFGEGWSLFRHRFHPDSLTSSRDFGHPEWAGEDIRDKAIVVWGDQGVGDEILFANLIPEIVARARVCIVECAYKLVPLFARSFPAAVVVPKMAPPHPATQENGALQIAVADAARWLRPDLGSFPSHDGYLIADPARVAYWKARLAEIGPGLKVGIGWRSHVFHGQRSLHYTSLDQWGPIFKVSGVHFINLQYGQCAEELAAARKRFGLPLHAFEEVDLFDDLAEAAALNKALDLVICAPTSTSLLSAALGVPAWMMSYTRPWQMMGTEEVPWLPAMRCFPRRCDQPWEEVIAAIAEALELCARKAANADV